MGGLQVDNVSAHILIIIDHVSIPPPITSYIHTYIHRIVHAYLYFVLPSIHISNKSHLHPYLHLLYLTSISLPLTCSFRLHISCVYTFIYTYTSNFRYKGPSLLECIDSFTPPPRPTHRPLRLVIAETLKSRSLGQAAISGKLEGGGIQIGTKVRSGCFVFSRVVFGVWCFANHYFFVS